MNHGLASDRRVQVRIENECERNGKSDSDLAKAAFMTEMIYGGYLLSTVTGGTSFVVVGAIF